MKSFIGKLKKINSLINILFSRQKLNTEYYQSRMIVENRILLKKLNKQKLNIVLIAFEPATWLMFHSIYEVFSRCDKINITVFVIPYAHSTLPEGTYKDDGLREYLDALNIPYIYGYNEKTKEWSDIFNLHPDYVFYQAPYNGMYPDILKSGYVSQFAQICYVPYGAFLQAPELEETVHPKDFFTAVEYFFLPTKIHCNMFIQNSLKRSMVFDNTKIVPSGLTKTDYIKRENKNYDKKPDTLTILWTPRWNTREGVCTFFDYYEYLVELTEANKNIHLIFRPHPLMFQNFLKTGELSKADIEKIGKDFSVSNRTMDKNAGYTDSFEKADVLISDVSSMMYEFFLYQKPIIYTHKKNFFNTFAVSMAETFYWAHNSDELTVHINTLLKNDDYKKEQRINFIHECIPHDKKAAEIILDTIIR